VKEITANLAKRSLTAMTKKKINDIYPKLVLLEGVVMANGEFLHYGESLGYINKRQRDLLESGAHKIARGNEPVIALGDQVA